MKQVIYNSVKALVKKNEKDCLLFELDKKIYLVKDGYVYSVSYVNDLISEVRINRNDGAFKVYIEREAEVKKLYKAYRLQVLYWTDYDKKGASRNLIEKELAAFLVLVEDSLVKVSDVDDFLISDIELDLVLKSLEDNLALF